MSGLRSMTGYGSATLETPELRAAVTLRSLNHRYLEVSARLPRGLAALEPAVKALVESRLSRGKLELSLRAELPEGTGEAVAVARGLARGVVRALREIQIEHRLDGGVDASDVARFPGVIEVAEAELAPARRDALLDLVARGLEELVAMRRTEGGHLADHLSRVLDAVEAAAGRIEALSAEGKAARHAALVEKARGLAAELGLDEGRLYAELARLVERSDVSEEVERLRSHVAHARSLMREEAPAGRRLDFLAQELMREANTVGSKSGSAPLSHEVVALKGEIERFREQVQNVE